MIIEFTPKFENFQLRQIFVKYHNVKDTWKLDFSCILIVTL